MHFRVVLVENSPYVNVDKNEAGKLTMSGPLAEMFSLLATYLNFTYSLTVPPHRIWGTKNSNGTWSGMIGTLLRNEADIAIGPFTLTYNRFEAVQTSIPFFADDARILVREEEQRLSMFSFIGIFSWEVWLLLLISTIIVTSVMTVADIMEDSKKNIAPVYFRNLWFNCRVFFNQEIARTSHGKGKHMLEVFWMISIMFMTFIFGGNFLSRLVLQKPPEINSLEDLVATPHLYPILERESSLAAIFQLSAVPSHQNIFRRVQKDEKKLLLTFDEIEHEAIDRVRRGPYAIVTDTASLKGFLADRYSAGHPCNFHMSKNGFLELWKVIMFTKTFPKKYKDKINTIARRIAEAQWLRPRMELEYTNYSRCIEPKHVHVPTLKLVDMEGVFLIFAIGITGSLVAFISELLVWHGIKEKPVPAIIKHLNT